MASVVRVQRIGLGPNWTEIPANLGSLKNDFRELNDLAAHSQTASSNLHCNKRSERLRSLLIQAVPKGMSNLMCRESLSMS